MHKKLMLACMAIVAFAAFVMAPLASAATLTENGVAVPVGTSITGTATEFKYTTGISTFTCSHVEMSGTVTANANGTVAVEIPAGNPNFTGTASGGSCTSDQFGTVKWTVNSKLCLHIPKGTDIGTITGCGGASATFTLDGPSCKYSASSLAGTITTVGAGKDAEVNVLEQGVKREESIFCPEEFKFDMEFRLTTTDGSTLTFS